MAKLMLVHMYLALGFMLFVSSSLNAATVIKKRAKKSVIVIDEGKASGFEKGVRVCFYSPNDKKRACGKVVRAKKKRAFIRVPRKRFKKVRKGFAAEIADGGGGGGSSSGSMSGTALRMSYLPAVVSTATYNKINFKPPEGTAETLWDNAGASNNTFFGFGGGLEFRDFGLDIGFKYRIYQAYLVDTSWSPLQSQQANFVDHKLEGNSIGISIDYLMYSNMGGGSALAYGFGLDVDNSTITFSAIHKNDDDASFENSLFTASSAGSIISLRVPFRYDLGVDSSFGLSFGGALLIPVSGAPTTSVEIAENEEQINNLSGIEPADDFIAALGHTKSSVGFDLLIGFYLVF